MEKDMRAFPFEEVAKQYEKARKRARITQTELAANAGMEPANISRFEGGRYNPSYEMMVRVADAMGMRLEIKLVKKR